MLTTLALVAASVLGGAVGAIIVYRVYAPKMEGRLRQSLHDTQFRWEDIASTHINDTFAEFRLDAKHDRQRDKTEMLKLLTGAYEVDFAKLAQTLQEQIDALTQDAADAIDNRIANAIATAKPTEAKLDGVSTDKPDEVDEDERRQATGGKFHM